MPGIDILLIFACMLMVAFFAGMETGVISIHRVRLRHLVDEGSRGAIILKQFVDKSDMLLGTTLVGTNIGTVAASVIAARYATGISPVWGKAVSSVVMTLLILVFCEYIPKSWFTARPLERCAILARPLRASWIILRPISEAITWLTQWMVPGGRTDHLRGKRPFVTREDLKVLTRDLHQSGEISPKEHTMIHRVFDLSKQTVGDIMVPRDRMITIDSEATVQELVEETRNSGFTRLPVYDREEGAFVGTVNAVTILSSHGPRSMNNGIRNHVRPPRFLAENMPVDDVLGRMRSLRQPMCLVTNSTSEVTGLITAEDVLEEIVGQL